MKAILDKSKCPAVATCPAISACPEGAIRHEEDRKDARGGRIIIEHLICTGCGDCVPACCGEAITLAEVQPEEDEILPEEAGSKTMSVKVLGLGCANCDKLTHLTQKAINSLSIDVKVEKVTEYADFAKYRLLVVPGLVINEKLVAAGRVPSEAEIITFLTDALMSD